MRTAIVYISGGGNTKALADLIQENLFDHEVELLKMEDISAKVLEDYDGIILGCYSWDGTGLPPKAEDFLEELEDNDINLTDKVTAVFGTGETNFSHFCIAVDIFASFFDHFSKLCVTLKVEQLYQDSDIVKVEKFCEIYENNMKGRP